MPVLIAETKRGFYNTQKENTAAAKSSSFSTPANPT
jgi:hypothetical protein